MAELPSENLPRFPPVLDEIAKLAAACSIRLLFHNHDGELIDRVDGVPQLQYLLDHTRPERLRWSRTLAGWKSAAATAPNT